jgi:hypothetical protein
MSTTFLPVVSRRVAGLLVAVALLGARPAAADGQQPGQATYTAGGPNGTLSCTGSAKAAGTFPIAGFIPKLPHLTYVIFRNTPRNVDQVVIIDALGDFIERRGSVQQTEGHRPGENVHVIDVADVHNPVVVEVVPKSVAVLRLTFGKEEPAVVLYSDRRLMIDYPSFFSINDRFTLSELRSVHLEKPFLVGQTKARFVLRGGKEVEVAYADPGQAERAYEELWPVLRAMAPSLDCGAARTWTPLLVGVGVGVFLLLVIAGKAKKA